MTPSREHPPCWLAGGGRVRAFPCVVMSGNEAWCWRSGRRWGLLRAWLGSRRGLVG